MNSAISFWGPSAAALSKSKAKPIPRPARSALRRQGSARFASRALVPAMALATALPLALAFPLALPAVGQARAEEPVAMPSGDSTSVGTVEDPKFRPFPDKGEEVTVIQDKSTDTEIDITNIRNRIIELRQQLNDIKTMIHLEVSKNFAGNIMDVSPDSVDLDARVIGLKEKDLPNVEPKEGQVIFWDGAKWQLAEPPPYIITGPKGTVLE